MAEYGTTEGETPKRTKASANAIISECKDRLTKQIDAEGDQRRKMLDDLAFLDGQQWPETAKLDPQRITLTLNRVDQICLLVSNSMRQNRVSARVSPVDDKGDPETAKMIQGTLRHIENNSKGTLAYDTGGFYAVAMGLGFWGLKTDYEDPLSFNQDIQLERCSNPFQWYLGEHDLPDGSDAEWGAKFCDYTHAEYKQTFPDSEVADISMDAVGADQKDWISEDKVRVVKYYRKEYEDGVLVQLQDGTAKLESDLGPGDKRTGVKRDTQICKVRIYTLNAFEILSEKDWPIPHIPIVKVTGHELTVNGKQKLKGIVRNLKDAQRQFNIMRSAQTQAVMNSQGNVVYAEGQLEEVEGEWRKMHKGQPLPYSPKAVGGELLPPPGRLEPNQSIAWITEAVGFASEDLKALVTLYDDSLGRGANDKSGKAIMARQAQGDTANFHYPDNLTRSITWSCQMTVKLIPHIYDTARVVRIIGEDDTQKIVRINQVIEEGGQERNYNFAAGKYDVVCSAGPSFATKRQEGSAFMVELVRANPQVLEIAGDLVFKAMDIPYADELAERFKKALPPHLQEKDGEAKVPPEIQQKLAQSAQVIEALTAQVNGLEDEKAAKKAESDAKMQVETIKAQKDVMLAEIQQDIEAMKLDSNEAIAALKAEIEHMKMGHQMQMAESARQAEEFAGTVAEK